MDPSSQVNGDGVFADPAQAQSAFDDGSTLVHQICQKLSDLEDQQHALKAVYAGNHSDTYQSAASDFQTNMSDVTRAGQAVIEAAHSALQQIVGADV
jgi:uncharacterized protein YukE